MTEKANPSINRPATAFHTAGAIGYGGHASLDDPGFVVDGSNPTEIAVQDGVVETNFNAFDQTSSASSLTVTISAGEAFVFGSWIAKDTNTNITLNQSQANQTIYVGWNKNGSNDVIVGPADTFSAESGDTDLKIPLWEFDTDASGVTSSTDLRRIGYSANFSGGATFGSGNEVEVSYYSGRLNIDGPEVLIGDPASDSIRIPTSPSYFGDSNNNAIQFWDGANNKWSIVSHHQDGTFRLTLSNGTERLRFDDSGATKFLNQPVQAPSYEDSNGNTMMDSVAATGQIQLSGGSGVVNTGINAVDATFSLAIGVDDPNADTKVSGRLFWDDSADQYKIEIVETATSVGNPVVNYDVIRVR